MTTHDEAFLEAIREQPDDDAPRLIYADWLEEHGQPERAEFIRVQCGKERVPSGSPRYYEFLSREQALLVEHEKEWLGSLNDVLKYHQFRRGFLDSIELEPYEFLRKEAELFHLGPIRELSLSKPYPLLPSVLASPLLDQVTSLSFTNDLFGSAVVNALCGSPRLKQLRGLNLSHNHLNMEAVAALCQAPFFAQLRYLDLSNNHDIGATAMEHLVGSGGTAHLRHLNVAFDNLGDAGLQVLTSARPFYRRLMYLDVSGNEVSAAGIRSLSHRKGNLLELYATNNLLGDDAVRTLASSSAFSKLTVLDLGRTRLGSESCAALARSPHLHALTSLHLSGNSIGQRGARELAAASNLTRLELLDLTGDEIGDEGVKALANSSYLTNLHALFVGVNGLRPWGLRELIMSPHLANLYTLDLHGNNLRDEGAQVIARWCRLTQLTDLMLRGNRIGDLGVQELAASPHLPSLRVLDLGSNAFSDDAAVALKRSSLREQLLSLKLNDETIEVAGLLPPSNS
jgi:uncharacterized protein (TIGR02996 family)